MKVFVVEEGVFCEGGVVCGVFFTMVKALNWVGKHYDLNCWELARMNRWERGCNYVEINEYEVE